VEKRGEETRRRVRRVTRGKAREAEKRN